jgi:Amt family ammonium transporter
MWMAAFFGMATKYAEGLLAIRYRTKDDNGHISGGPMYYILHGMGEKWRPLAIFFAVAGVLVCVAVYFIEDKLKVDDPVGAVAVHGCNGIWGTIAVGLFDYKDGLFYGGGVHHLLIQLLGIVCIAGWTIVTMTIVFTVLKKTIGLRVSAQEEVEGLDSTEHGLESGYPDFVPRELH